MAFSSLLLPCALSSLVLAFLPNFLVYLEFASLALSRCVYLRAWCLFNLTDSFCRCFFVQIAPMAKKLKALDGAADVAPAFPTEIPPLPPEGATPVAPPLDPEPEIALTLEPKPEIEPLSSTPINPPA
ncbi:hypothetical protein NE237_013392 [Protea cynaroides]|uniref:Uncharacterized protein n=1 Tax=Protea cynaroides TaxID=273540 RepID=A0A9Q0GZT8_9MAGN|nr:hypothetical protein NE237_013392 [Protea cynaroides]